MLPHAEFGPSDHPEEAPHFIFFYFSSDLVYVIIFPQLLLVVHFEEKINARGSQLGFFMGMLVRISGGESKLKIPAIIKYPGYD